MALYGGLHPAQLKDSVTSKSGTISRSTDLTGSSLISTSWRCIPSFHGARLIAAPGGCTIAGLLTMEDGKVRSTMARAIQVATNQYVLLSFSPPPFSARPWFCISALVSVVFFLS